LSCFLFPFGFKFAKCSNMAKKISCTNIQDWVSNNAGFDDDIKSVEKVAIKVT
jgi:hypothetical protein